MSRIAAMATSAAALVFAALALAPPAQAGSGYGHHGAWGSSASIEGHAEELGLDEATLAEIRQIVETSRAEAEEIGEEHRQARDALRALLESDAPDSDAVMQQAEVIGDIGTRKRQHHLATLLAVRAKLSPDQRAQLHALKQEKRQQRGEGCPYCAYGKNAGEGCPRGADGKHGAEGCPHRGHDHQGGGECREGAPPTASEEL